MADKGGIVLVGDKTTEDLNVVYLKQIANEEGSEPERVEKVDPETPGPAKLAVNYKMLKVMCQYMATVRECAAAQGMSVDTLNARLKEDGHGNFRSFFTEYRARGLMALRVAQFQKALKEKDTTMQIHLGRSYLGQGKEGVEIDDEFSLLEAQDQGEAAESFDDITDAIFEVIEAKSAKA